MARLSRVIFIGGSRYFGSVQIRCIQVAEALGCDYLCIEGEVGMPSPSQLASYDIAVLVEPPVHVERFAGLVRVWDLIDERVPDEIDIVLGSTKFSLAAHSDKRTVLIPHHHLNNADPNPPDLQTPGWVGWREWYPAIEVDHEVHYVDGADAAHVRRIYRTIGIGLNLRRRGKNYEQHVASNSGIKLINCFGFGIASVSEPEPAYVEIGDGCTLFTTLESAREDVLRLGRDSALRMRLRRAALARAGDFSLSRVAHLYRRFLERL